MGLLERVLEKNTLAVKKQNCLAPDLRNQVACVVAGEEERMLRAADLSRVRINQEGVGGELSGYKNIGLAEIEKEAGDWRRDVELIIAEDAEVDKGSLMEGLWNIAANKCMTRAMLEPVLRDDCIRVASKAYGRVSEARLIKERMRVALKADNDVLEILNERVIPELKVAAEQAMQIATDSLDIGRYVPSVRLINNTRAKVGNEWDSRSAFVYNETSGAAGEVQIDPDALVVRTSEQSMIDVSQTVFEIKRKAVTDSLLLALDAPVPESKAMQMMAIEAGRELAWDYWMSSLPQDLSDDVIIDINRSWKGSETQGRGVFLLNGQGGKAYNPDLFNNTILRGLVSDAEILDLINVPARDVQRRVIDAVNISGGRATIADTPMVLVADNDETKSTLDLWGPTVCTESGGKLYLHPETLLLWNASLGLKGWEIEDTNSDGEYIKLLARTLAALGLTIGMQNKTKTQAELDVLQRILGVHTSSS